MFLSRQAIGKSVLGGATMFRQFQWQGPHRKLRSPGSLHPCHHRQRRRAAVSLIVVTPNRKLEKALGTRISERFASRHVPRPDLFGPPNHSGSPVNCRLKPGPSSDFVAVVSALSNPPDAWQGTSR